MPHPLEKKFNASGKDILDAISHGFRAQVDVKGKLAELYLYKILKKLEKSGQISNLCWIDEDGLPDFTLTYKLNSVKVECKNVRNEVFRNPELAFKVEIQKTRNSKDGTNTRSYRKDYFDVLAACTFNQTGKWEFAFIKASKMEVLYDNHRLLKIMQRMPVKIAPPWTKDILSTLNEKE